MPIRDGLYVPMTRTEQSQANRTIRSILAAGLDSKKVALAEVVKKLNLDQMDMGQLQYQYAIARKSLTAAALLRRTHNKTPLASDIPPMIGPSDHRGQYQYEVLVVTRNSSGEVVSTTRGYRYYDSPQSLQSTRSDVSANLYQIVNQQKTSTVVGRNAGSDPITTTTVLSVGRIV